MGGRLISRPNSLLFLSISLIYFIGIVNAAKLTDVFKVKTGTDDKDGGSCDKSYNAGKGVTRPYIDTLNQFWDDTTKLATQAADGVKKSAEDTEEGLQARRNLRGWFGLEFNDDGKPVDETNEEMLKTITGTFWTLHAFTTGGV